MENGNFERYRVGLVSLTVRYKKEVFSFENWADV